jgi:NitT/TauT family transport system ATP-binding protein
VSTDYVRPLDGVERPSARQECISLTSVAKTYESIKGDVVHGLAPTTLSIERGSFVSFVGRSGCGKSTLLRMIAGLTAPASGAIGVDGQRVSGPVNSVRYVFQNYNESLLPWKTVGENVKFGLRHSFDKDSGRSRHSAAELIDQHLAEVGLEGTAQRFPSELSGGMQQRVAIARALASRPRVLLLDEPFSAVDALSRANLQDLVLRVWKEHELTVLFVTHDIDEALYLSDRVVALRPSGRGVAEDFDVPLDRPRHQMATRESKDYLQLRRTILETVLA